MAAKHVWEQGQKTCSVRLEFVQVRLDYKKQQQKRTNVLDQLHSVPDHYLLRYLFVRVIVDVSCGGQNNLYI